MINGISSILNSASVGILLLSLGISLLITLFASLIVREFSAGNGITSKLLNRNLDVLFIPLLFVCCFLILVKFAVIVT